MGEWSHDIWQAPFGYGWEVHLRDGKNLYYSSGHAYSLIGAKVQVWMAKKDWERTLRKMEKEGTR